MRSLFFGFILIAISSPLVSSLFGHRGYGMSIGLAVGLLYYLNQNKRAHISSRLIGSASLLIGSSFFLGLMLWLERTHPMLVPVEYELTKGQLAISIIASILGPYLAFSLGARLAAFYATRVSKASSESGEIEFGSPDPSSGPTADGESLGARP